eukprot:TRINITY_DN20082_c0_g1_i1.p1 TRINITY_DN20082_c0_g1~~TRINITY_DN20082_c0_g1_i1.p1  ORF type:complete len:280 (-),score=104.23 TRINITY_DN20082_c0_g1_i1:597-1436(-)
MSEVGSNSSAEEISPEEIEEIQIKEDDDEAAPTQPTTENKPTEQADDPPLEVLTPQVAESVPAESASAAETDCAPAAASDSSSVVAPAAADVATADPAAATDDSSSAAAAPEVEAATADSSSAAGGAASTNEAVTIEDVADVEEVSRPPLVDPPMARPSGAGTVASTAADDDDDDDDEDIDETLSERLVGLTEMFPDFVRNGTVSLVKGSWDATKYMYGFSRSAAWIFFSTASILFMPVMIESERLSLMDQQKQQKTQMLLGPGIAGSGGAPALGPPPI